MVGDEDPFNASAGRLPRVDARTQQRRLLYWQKTLAALDRIPTNELSAEERVNAAVFRASLETFLASGRFRTWEMPFNTERGFWSSLIPRAGYSNPDQYRRYLGRMRDVPRYFDEQITNMRAGLKRGFSVPRAALEGKDASILAFTVADPQKNPFYTAFKAMPAGIPPAEQKALRAEAELLIREAIVPGYTKLLTFFRTEYLPKARRTVAAERMPGGADFYRAQIKEHTTLAIGPDEVHQIGVREVGRIRSDIERTIAAAGFQGGFRDFLRSLRSNSDFVARTPDELLAISAYAAKRVDGKLKDLFAYLPRHRFTILPVPAVIAPFHTAGRGGLDSCLINTYDLPSRPTYSIPALTLHECVPGHSFQAALAREQPSRPSFRKQTYFSGFGEGWGLYAEWLGIEMGIYRNPHEEFGRQTYEVWRAARLVVDTGIHHYGWSREEAVAYLEQNTALSPHEIELEVDRYISWPGQALAYKLGELHIRRLRAVAEQKLAENFDVRAFHDMILGLGSVPLPVLEAEVQRWIAAGGKNPSAGN